MKAKNSPPINLLTASNEAVLSYLKKVIREHNFNYKTFGVDIEPYISSILIDIFSRNGFIKSKKDYKLAPDKNYFPDFELKSSVSLAIEYKSGNKIKFFSGKWIACKNSNNDMGTLNTWLKKIDKFGKDNIYYIFVIYKFDSKNKEILEVQIAPFYKFIGKNKAGLLSYREKDGNLRPKDFDQMPFFKSFKDFNKLFKKTVIYRSKRIIKKHKEILKSLSSK